MRFSNIPDVNEEWKTIFRQMFGFSTDKLIDGFRRGIEGGCRVD
jgi:hypothetical protein